MTREAYYRQQRSFSKAQAEYDNRTPDEPEEVECPECGDLMERYKVGPDDGWICNACGYEQEYPEPDFEAILENNQREE